jgi:hypothetical protein
MNRNYQALSMVHYHDNAEFVIHTEEDVFQYVVHRLNNPNLIVVLTCSTK